MIDNRKCPKCGRFCKIDQARSELGLPIECVCGCKFDVLLAASLSYQPQPKKQNTQEKKDNLFTKKLVFNHLIYPFFFNIRTGNYICFLATELVNTIIRSKFYFDIFLLATKTKLEKTKR